MATTERVTVTLPADLVRRINRLAKNRSRFIADAVAHELARLRQEGLQRSLEDPHAESTELAETGLDEWAASLPTDDDGLVDASAGKPVRWIDGRGWVEEV